MRTTGYVTVYSSRAFRNERASLDSNRVRGGPQKCVRFLFAFVYNSLTKGTAMIKSLLKFAFYSLPLIAFLANFTEPRAEVSASTSAPSLSAPAKVVIYEGSREQTTVSLRTSGRAVSPRQNRTSTQQVKAYVRTEAVEYGVNPNLALWIVKHESSFNPQAKGDGEASRGLWQISKVYHPEVSDAAAFSVTSSTEWSLERIRKGKVSEWSTYRNCRTLYKDCPF